MKQEFLDIQFFKILSKEIIPEGATRDQIITIAEMQPEFPHIIGTPKFVTNEKLTDAGSKFEHQFAFSVPSYTNETDLAILRNAGAVIIYTDLRTLVIYHNDVFSNAPLKFSIKSNNEVTDVELIRESLYLL